MYIFVVWSSALTSPLKQEELSKQWENKHDNKLRLLHHESELCAEYEDECDAEETETTGSCSSRVYVDAACVRYG